MNKATINFNDFQNKNRTLYCEHFNSYTELLKTNDSRDIKFVGAHDRDTKIRNFDFDSYEQAVNWLFNYEKNLKLFKTKFKNNDSRKNVEHKKSQNIVDVAGFQPIIPNALMGLPKSMISTRMVSKKSKIVNILIDCTFAHSVKQHEVAEYFSELLAYIASIEKQGFRTRISIMYFFGQAVDDKPMYMCTVRLKSENQPFDLKRMMFPLTNAGSLRLFGFDWYERHPDAVRISGYGRAIHNWTTGQQKNIKTLLDNPQMKTYYFHLWAPINKTFENLK